MKTDFNNKPDNKELSNLPFRPGVGMMIIDKDDRVLLARE